jgi:hypothetical protein
MYRELPTIAGLIARDLKVDPEIVANEFVAAIAILPPLVGEEFGYVNKPAGDGPTPAAIASELGKAVTSTAQTHHSGNGGDRIQFAHWSR